jgi:hypothetical protein
MFKKICISIIVVLFVLVSSRAYAQYVCPPVYHELNTDQEQALSMSTMGCQPDPYSFSGANGFIGDNVSLRSTVNGQTCLWSTGSTPGAGLDCSANVAPGAGAIWNVRIQDGNGATLGDVVQLVAGAVLTQLFALTTASATFGHVIGGDIYAAIDIVYPAINTALGFVPLATTAFGMSYDPVALNFDVNTTHAYGDALAADQQGVDSICYNMFYDPTGSGGGGVISRRWTGSISADGTSAQRAPYVENFNMAYDVTNNHWDRLRADANGNLTVNQTTGFPGYGRIQDGDSTVLADVEDAFADGKALTLNGLMTQSAMMLYNGATLDMARNGAVKELQVTDVATRPGEDAANDWRKTKKQEIAVWTPAKEASGNIAAAAVVVLASKEIISWPNCCLYLRNKDAAQVLTNAQAFTSPDNAGTCGDANWTELTWGGCDALAAGATCVYCFSASSYRYFCASATAAAPAADVDSVEAWITCNKG